MLHAASTSRLPHGGPEPVEGPGSEARRENLLPVVAGSDAGRGVRGRKRAGLPGALPAGIG